MTEKEETISNVKYFVSAVNEKVTFSVMLGKGFLSDHVDKQLIHQAILRKQDAIHYLLKKINEIEKRETKYFENISR